MGLKEDLLFLEIVYFLFWGSSKAAMGGGARSAPVCVLRSSKRRVREAHGRMCGQNPLVLNIELL